MIRSELRVPRLIVAAPLRHRFLGVPVRLTWVCVLLLLGACARPDPLRLGGPEAAGASAVLEREPQSLRLVAPLNRPDLELSGLSWYGDTLVVLPQYPTRFPGTTGSQVYGISRSDLLRAVRDSSSGPLNPFPIPFDATNLGTHLTGYQGCEAIAFIDNTVYVLTEGRKSKLEMRGTLLRGKITDSGETIEIRELRARSLPQQAALPNMSYEALTTRGDTVLALFEANGANVNESPRAYLFDRSLEPLDGISFPTLEYRLTDATGPDARGRFWVTNYFFPGDRSVVQPAPDSLVEAAHDRADAGPDRPVERLVEYEYTLTGIRRTLTPPVRLKLGPSPRNWEGIARLGRGFVIVTDTFPTTILAYVPGPQSSPPAVSDSLSDPP